MLYLRILYEIMICYCREALFQYVSCKEVGGGVAEVHQGGTKHATQNFYHNFSQNKPKHKICTYYRVFSN